MHVGHGRARLIEHSEHLPWGQLAGDDNVLHLASRAQLSLDEELCIAVGRLGRGDTHCCHKMDDVRVPIQLFLNGTHQRSDTRVTCVCVVCA